MAAPRVYTCSIPGAILVTNIISAAEEKALLAEINTLEWSTALARRTQHYGYTYAYDNPARLKPAAAMPSGVAKLARNVSKVLNCIAKTHPDADDLREYIPDQALINEYMPSQGISAHVDTVKLFGPVIVSVSLGSDVVMDVVPIARKADELPPGGGILLARRSALILSGSARYEYTHAIAKRKTDDLSTCIDLQVGNKVVKASTLATAERSGKSSRISRDKRVSVTYRTVLDEAK